MTFSLFSRPAPHRIAPALLLTSLLFGGCASRSLVTPPQVVDWSTGSQSAKPSPAPAQLYTVRREDTLASIAKRFNTTPAELAAWNSLGPNPRVKVDQVLRVSSPASSGAETSAPVATTQPIGNETVEQRPLGADPGRTAPPPVTPSAAATNAPIKSGPLGVKRPYSDATLAELSRPDGDVPVPSSSVAPPVAPQTAAPPSPSSTALTWSWPAGGKAGNAFADGKTKGIDIAGKPGDAVLAAADGKVTFSGAGVRGYGNFVIIRHTPELLSVYANNRVNLVKEGAVVTKGQKIAEMGSSDTDAVKLHFEIRNDSKPVDPMKYLPER